MEVEKQLPTFFYVLLLYFSTTGLLVGAAAASSSSSSATTTKEIQRGFSANPDLESSSSTFQSVLTDPAGVFSFGFLRLDSEQLDLAVLHVPSSLPVWRAIPSRPASWGGFTVLSFNGSLVLSDPDGGVLWSTNTNDGGRLVLLNSSNLQVQKLGEPSSVLWQSFDFPSDTLVQGQNFTSTASLFSSNRKFSMGLGLSYLALFMEFGGIDPAPMYWKHTALEAKAQIVQGEGAIIARVEPVGFLGIYQSEKAPADVIAFDTFNRGVPGFRRLTLESDGNLQAYYWNGSLWVREYVAISDPCSLPAVCGPYGLCGSRQPMCRCLDNSTNGCFPAGSGDLCGSDDGDELRLVRRKGVDLANKELLGYTKLGSLEECESSCASNCSCWGAVYSNSSGFCYRIDYPIQTLLEVADVGKSGYFKVRREEREERSGRRTRVALLVVGALVFSGAAVFGAYRVWERRKKSRTAFGLDGSMAEGLSPGPYKNLSSTGSFRSIELSNSFSK